MEYERQGMLIPLGILSTIEKKANEFAKADYPDHVCMIDEIYTDSSWLTHCNEKRIDVWLYFEKREKREDGITYITDAFRQKMFLINGELLTCKEYRNKKGA